jgi:pimeloyl-ACP methyl ester carboxylesterase
MDEKTDAGYRERTIAIPGLNMHIIEAGSGTPVLLLHGFPQTSREWRATLPHLAARARVIAPDLRGSGRTDAPDGSYRLDVLRADAVGLLDALGIDRAVVVGHDLGAIPALSLAVEHPERVSHLVVLSVPPLYLKVTPSMLGSVRYLWFQYALAVPGLGPRLLSGGRQRLPRWLFSSFEENGGVPDADVEEYLADLRIPAHARAGSRKYRQLVVPEFMRIVLGRYRGRLPSMPTLVLLGARDRIIPRDALAGVEKYAPNVRMEDVPDAGHWIVDEQPVEVARRIADFAGLA